jgi:hypothetical protein
LLTAEFHTQVQDGFNWYIYCDNNPLKFVDPTGLSKIKKKTTSVKMEYDLNYNDYNKLYQWSDDQVHDKFMEQNDWNYKAAADTITNLFLGLLPGGSILASGHTMITGTQSTMKNETNQNIEMLRKYGLKQFFDSTEFGELFKNKDLSLKLILEFNYVQEVHIHGREAGHLVTSNANLTIVANYTDSNYDNITKEFNLKLNNTHDKYTFDLTAINPVTAFIVNNFQNKSRVVSRYITEEKIKSGFFGLGEKYDKQITPIK